MAQLKAPLSFLRPLALPRPSTITSFFNVHRSLVTSTTQTAEPTTERKPVARYVQTRPTSFIPRVRPSQVKSTTIPLVQPSQVESTTIPLVQPSQVESTTIPLVQPSQVESSLKTNNPNLAYNVLRTKTKSLPIYLDEKRGGNLLLTRIRKVEGDRDALVQDLDAALNLEKIRARLRKKLEQNRKKNERMLPQEEEKLIWINPITQHIVIRGHHKDAVEKFLLHRGF